MAWAVTRRSVWSTKVVVRIGLGVRFGHGDGGGQFLQPAAAHGDRGDDRNTQPGFKRGGIKYQPVALGQVHHVERDHGGPAQGYDFLRENQMLFEVGGIQHHNQHFGRRFARELAEDDLSGHLLIRAGGMQAIGTGQVGEFNVFAQGQDQPARLAFHRDAGIVRDLLPRAGQGVEQGRFPGIGIADERGAAMAGHAFTLTPARPSSRGHGRGAGRPSSGRP
jgi:hypothetical protein